MTFTMKIKVVNDKLESIAFDNMTQAVGVGAALQAIESAKIALLNIVVAQPKPPESE